MNLLFITADQWRGECLSAAGHPIVKTPNIDALAADGVRFANHYAQAAPCGPSRASLYSGLYLHNHRSGTNFTPLDDGHDNFARGLRRAGYDPALVGYTDIAPDPRAYPSDHPALSENEGVLPGLKLVARYGLDPYDWGAHVAAHGFAVPDPAIGIYLLRDKGPDYEDGAPHPKPFAIPKELNDTAYGIDQAMNFIREQMNGEDAKPWALHLSLLRPHPPWIASEPYNALYDPADMPAPMRADTAPDEGAQHPYLAHQLGQRGFLAPADPKKQARLKAVYYGLMTEVDDHIGRLMARLKALDVYDDTLIIFTSDHGEQMGDHWLIGKCGYFDQSYHIPLIIKAAGSLGDGGNTGPRPLPNHPQGTLSGGWEGGAGRPGKHAKSGTVINAYTEHVDIYPTLIDMMELPPPGYGTDAPGTSHLDGHSLRPFLEQGETPDTWRQEVHWEYEFRNAMDTQVEATLGLSTAACKLSVIRDEAFKYVHFVGLPPLLFDLGQDPHELVNRAGDPAYTATLSDYAQRLLSWHMAHNDPGLSNFAITSKGVFHRPPV